MSELPFVAHTPPEGMPDKWQTMTEHIEGVTERAVRYAAPFNAEELARWLAWLHDVGKYSPEFQKYLRDCHDAKMNGTPAPAPGSAEHKCAGAKLALDLFPMGISKLMAACVYGHHGGLKEKEAAENAVADQAGKRKQQEQIPFDQIIRRARQDFPLLNQPLPDTKQMSCLDISHYTEVLKASSKDKALRYLEMLTRFLFSCLVDADSLDTEKHGSPVKAALRTYKSLSAVSANWLRLLMHDQRRLRIATIAEERKLRAEGKRIPPVNDVRRKVYRACLQAGLKKPGVFSLTVPTGGGKTRSSLAFALTHTLAHAGSPEYYRSRIIYAIPYTSIIDQTANTFRDILGKDNILEHHSAIEVSNRKPDENDLQAQAEQAREQQRRLASENWEAPLVVTTTNQLFESLFANRTLRCRKVHNIARSIIILDEVQTLPANLLTPLIEGLETLVERFGVTVVLCTATQPAISGETPFTKLPPATPIVAEPEQSEFFNRLRRVKYQPVPTRQWTWEEIALKIKAKNESVLTVLNTKKDALALFNVLKGENVRHLSTLLCTAHRKRVLEQIEKELEAERKGNGPPILLVSTQVIEAGVDIDFPHVFRAKGPLDRVIQAAGRCNREGKRDADASEVTVFDPADGTVPKDAIYKTAISLAINKMREENVDLDDPKVITAYFAELYGLLGPDQLDKHKVQAQRSALNYPAVSQKVRLIEEDTISVLVPYYKGFKRGKKTGKQAFDNLTDEIRGRTKRGFGMTRDLWQEVQSRTVSVFRYEAEKRSAALDWLVPDQLYLWTARYDDVLGIGDTVEIAIEDLINALN